jgi:segregation and condensation protein A
VVTFLAMLELAKEMLVEILQEAPLAPIYVKAKASHPEEAVDIDDTQPGESALIESSNE